MMIKKYYEFIFEDVNRSKSIVKTKLEEYEKLKKFLTSKNSAGYMGTMTDFLFNGVPYNELINLYQKIIDLKQKKIKFNLDEYKKYEDVLDSIAKKQISYKFKNIINKFPKEQKDLLGYPKELSPENILMISKLYDVDSSAFISKISRYKDEYDLIESIERFLSGKIKSFDRESIKSMLDKDLKLVFENDNIIILRTYTHESIVKVGSDTSWCIVSSKSTFESYTKKGQTQYVLIDYTKDTFDIDFKIGFTLSTNNDILYAHNVLDRPVKQLVNEILNSNKVDLEQINVTQKVDLSTITEKSKISDIENIILSGVLKQEGTDVYLLKIIVNKLQRLRNGSDVLGLIKTLFKSIISLKKSDVIFDEDFDKYKTLLGNYYGTIKKMLVNNIILVSKTMIPENIFRDKKKLAKYYKYWMSDLNEISPNYYINEVERDPDLVDAILYFSSKSKQTKSIKLITLYCKMTKGENINMDEVKNLIDSSKLYKYQYYNYFGIKYHFDPKRSHSMEAENIIPEKIKLDNNTYTYSINSYMRVLTNCEVTLQYNSDFLISSINEHYKIQGGKIVKKASFNSNAHVLSGIIDPIIDKLTSKSRKIAFVDGVEFPIKYKTTISYKFVNLKTADVDVVINK